MGLTARVGSTPTSGNITLMKEIDRKMLAYVTGLALGDGNLSNPNGRATRLRITCDVRYKNLLNRIMESIQILLPHNKVSIVQRPRNCVDVSCYSNRWEGWLGWKAGKGSKLKQKVSIPNWIQRNRKFTLSCLRGLIETDGSVYRDRKYKTVNFVTMNPQLAKNVMTSIAKLRFQPHLYKVRQGTNIKYTVRLSKNTEQFIRLLCLSKD